MNFTCLCGILFSDLDKYIGCLGTAIKQIID